MTLNTGFLEFDPVDYPPSQVGPLSGLTFAAKDVMDVRGHITGLGNPAWRDSHGPAEDHAAGVNALLNAGAHLKGKTHTDELAYSLAGKNVHYGTPPNPALPNAIPGGSSSGSASVTAAGLVDVALGTDTGGSVRIPASYCGLFGMRPTHGRTDLTGVAEMAHSFDTLGWFARDASLLKAVGQVLLPADVSPPSLTHVALLSDATALTSPELVEGSRHWQQQSGLTIKPDANVGDLDAFYEVFRTLQAFEVWAYFGDWIRTHQPHFGPGVNERFAMAEQMDKASADAARQSLVTLRQQVRSWLGDHRVLCLPTAAGAAPPQDATPEAVETVRARTLRLTAIAGISGCPQVTMPLLRDQRGPVGWSLIGPPDSDHALLSLAMQLSQHLDGGAQA